MVSGDTKRIVVIKDIKSNIIEEAILILKNDTGAEALKNGSTKLNIRNKINKDYLLKEAEFIINCYMRENKLQPVGGRAFERDEKRRKLFINIGINTALIASIGLLVFLVTKMF